jgi:PhnB protein
MTTINPWINFNGNAAEAFTFYQAAFGGELTKTPFFALSIGQNTLFGNDVPEEMGRVSEEENRSKIAVSAESREAADRIFNGLSAGGIVEMRMADSPWGSYFGMFRDKFGIEWIIEYSAK